jgi:hypothetical protein
MHIAQTIYYLLSYGFLVPWFSSLTVKFCVLCTEKKVGGICLFVYKSYFSLYVFQNLEKNPTKQESLVFLETTVQYVGESRKPTKN